MSTRIVKYLNRANNFSDPLWCKCETNFQKRMAYPFPNVLREPDECVEATDWIFSRASDSYHTDDTVNPSEWFNFIWTNTWAVRKRILQFHFDDLEAVGIIERCARFHIFSAHAFAEIDEPAFVAKFNFEHLGKCLITLKYFYHDLNNRDIYCANEAEFMCYYLIHFPKSYLSLQEFSPAIRESEPIKFALRFLETQSTNNFAAFFNLVKKATFLQACLLHRYFLPMRERALSVMLRSYSRGPNVEFQIDYPKLMSLLVFEDTNELESYVVYIGGTFDYKKVTFKPKGFIGAGVKPKIRSSISIIEAKRQHNLYHVFTGGEGPIIRHEYPPRVYVTKKYEPDVRERDFDPAIRWKKHFRMVESIWKSIFFKEINDVLVEIITSLRYPSGEPEYEYDDRSPGRSMISEQESSANESNLSTSYEASVERRMNLLRLQSPQKRKDSVSNEDDSFIDIETELVQEPQPEAKSTPEVSESSVDQEVTPDQKAQPSQDPVRLSFPTRMSKRRAWLVRARQALSEASAASCRSVSTSSPGDGVTGTSTEVTCREIKTAGNTPENSPETTKAEDEKESKDEKEIDEATGGQADHQPDEQEPSNTDSKPTHQPKRLVTLSLLRAVQKYRKFEENQKSCRFESQNP